MSTLASTAPFSETTLPVVVAVHLADCFFNVEP